MSLTCPPADLSFLLVFIYNLLIRHQNCKILIHNRSKLEILEDPFDVNAMDYNKSNALKSSLWEVQSLSKHYSSYVSKEVEKLSMLNQTNEFPLDESFENNSYEAVSHFQSNLQNVLLAKIKLFYKKKKLIDLELDSNKATANCAINYTMNDQVDNEYFDRNISNLLKIN